MRLSSLSFYAAKVNNKRIASRLLAFYGSDDIAVLRISISRAVLKVYRGNYKKTL